MKITSSFIINSLGSFIILLLCTWSENAWANCSIGLEGAFGLGTGIMSAFQGCINDAANTYIPQFSSAMNPYLWASTALALTLFGLRTVTIAHENMLKETVGLLFKIGIAVLISTDAANIYNGNGDPSGLFHGTGGLYGAGQELINFVGGPASWGMVDTIWFVLMGASMMDVTGGGGGQSAFNGSLGLMVGTALFTSTTGVTVALLGIQALLSVLFMIMRVMFMILLAQFGLALMMILAPVIAPLLMFSSHNPQSYTKQIFERWYSIILATLFEPMFVMALFSMMIKILNIFIITGAGITTLGSISSLLAQCEVGSSGSIEPCMEPDAPVSSHCQVGDPQAHNNGTNSSSYDWNWEQSQPNNSAPLENQYCAQGGTLNAGFTRLRTQSSGSGAGGGGTAPSAPLGLLVGTLLGIIIVTYILEDFISAMAKVARHIAGAAGIAMFEVASVPVESVAQSIVDSAGAAWKRSVERNPGNVPKILKDGAEGALAGARKAIK